MRFPLGIFTLVLGLVVSQTGCPKSSALPKDLRDFGKNTKPVVGGAIVSPLPPPQPLSADLAVLPPKSDPQGKIPALPGSPGAFAKSEIAPLPPLTQVSADDADDAAEEKRLLQRIRERREAKLKEKEKEKEKPNELPPAVEKEKPAELPLPKPPSEPPMVVPPLGKIPAPSPAPVVAIDMRAMIRETAKKYEKIPDYEARLTKREVVKGKAMPGEEMIFRYRKEPHSVYMFVTSDNGKGREILYVKGQNNGKMIVVTGKGDNALVGVGAKFTFDPEDPLATSKTRNRVANAGFGRTFGVLERFYDEDASGKRQAGTIRALGEVERPEYAKPMLGLEIVMVAGDDPNLPKGGKRKYFFDNDPNSASFGFPVLIITYENEKEVEYYCFDRFKMPANFAESDFSADKVGKKK
jgi:hypothetical protein